MQIRNSFSVTANTVKENFTRYLNLVETRFMEAGSSAREYLLDRLKLLIGSRLDWVDRIYDVAGEPTQEQNDSV